jgi:hypothetical protein
VAGALVDVLGEGLAINAHNHFAWLLLNLDRTKGGSGNEG